MRRPWSIRARTTLTFAVASMVLTAAVVLLVTWGSTLTLSDAYGSAVALQRSDAAEFGDAGGPEPRPGSEPSGSSGSPEGSAAAVVRVAAQTQWQWATAGVVAAGVLAGLVGWFVSRRVLLPVDRIAAAAERLSASTLHERIGLDGPDDELRRLARSIDDLLDRLETAFESQRRFVAQASHELRTPLAVQRTALQVGLHDGAGPAELVCVREELLEQNRRSEHLVESLLVLAEADRGLDGRTERIDLAALVHEVVLHAEDHAQRCTVRLTETVDTTSGLVAVTAEPVLTRQLLTNLVDNAIEYNQTGGAVVVRVRDDGLEVENSGPPVEPDEVAHLLEPFRRGRGAAPGRHSGLGLSIVTAITRAHGWTLAVVTRAEGGLVVRVRMTD